MAHYALQKLHMLPSVFVSLPKRELAFVYASTMARIEEEKEQDKTYRKGRRINRCQR